MIPITVAKNGRGPTALLTGGNHGDEYEAPTALFELAGSLGAKEVAGRMIIVPAMNFPAFRAARRASPIEAGNMNRIFPGRSDGTVAKKIADDFQRTLLSMADYVLDIQSSGKTLVFLAFAARAPARRQGAAGALRGGDGGSRGSLFHDATRDRRTRHV
jgi:N-alpha-acetyl-L-2,4-diaminobutyrate deacetylase